MESILIGISFSFLAGLGWLSCHQPSLTFKLIAGCLVICALLHLGAYVYKKAWLDSTLFIENKVKSVQPFHGPKKKALARIERLLDSEFSSSMKQIDQFWDYCNARFFTAYVVLICLLIFCWIQIRVRPPTEI